MKISIRVLNITLFVLGLIFSGLYIATKNYFFIIIFYFIFVFYFSTLIYISLELKFIFKNINNHNIDRLMDTPFYMFKEFSILGKMIKAFFSKDKMIGAINLTLNQSVALDEFYKVVVENFAIIINTPHVGFIVYDPIIEKMEFKYGNGVFSNITLSENFLFIQNKISNIISKEDFHSIFKEDFSNLKNIGIQRLNTSLNYTGYIIFGYSNQQISTNFFHESNTLLLEIQTAYNLHINNTILKQKIKDLNLLNKIITLMETNKDIDQLLHIFLTHVTANEGLSFNRAILFKKEESKKYLVGVKSIGPLTQKEAITKWESLEKCPIDLFLESNPKCEVEGLEPLERLVLKSKLFLHNDVLLHDIVSSKSYKIIDISSSSFSSSNKTVFQSFNLHKMIIVPLVSHDNFYGIFIVDNQFDGKAFSYERVNSLINFSNQTSLAINNILLYEKIKKLATIDELTQLHNRRFFEETLQSEVSRSLRYNTECSLIMIDLDFFKVYNDTNGHPAGDELLRLISKIFRTNCRSNDYVCRYGGEEFSIILPDTGIEGAYGLAEKIRKKVCENVFPYEEKQPNKKITISLGVSSLPHYANDMLSLKETADKALYAAKNNGKNQVLKYTKSMEK